MLDPDAIEAIYRGLRAVSLVTGALVAVDSIGVLFKPVEHPPHHPRWNAIAWLVASASVGLASAYLSVGHYGVVTTGDPVGAIVAPMLIYLGLIVAFTLRAVSRAHRPWLTVLSASCMSCLAVFMAWQDVVG